MAKGIRYTGEFMSIAGSRYRAEIWQEGFTGKPVELTFPYETPVSIEWAEVDKLEPVMSSAATLMVVSETDRQFVNLYTTQAGSTRLDIYRNNKLYWSGMLDPEIYEEPFSRERDYEVSLTFSDFALLDRIAFEQTGTNNRQRIKLRTVLDMAVKQSGINTGADWQTFLSTTTSAGASLLDGVYVSEDNFFDEDGEPMTLREVLEGVLRPFGLQMVQKDGRINLYDLHALSEGLQPRRVRWCLADSALGVDKTYNNCELTYSPYMSNNLVEASIEPDMIKDATSHRYPAKLRRRPQAPRASTCCSIRSASGSGSSACWTPSTRRSSSRSSPSFRVMQRRAWPSSSTPAQGIRRTPSNAAAY